MRGRTTLLIAHRLAMIQKVNRIIDAGRHHEPAARNPLYARLAALQFGGSEMESK